MDQATASDGLPKSGVGRCHSVFGATRSVDGLFHVRMTLRAGSGAKQQTACARATLVPPASRSRRDAKIQSIPEVAVGRQPLKTTTAFHGAAL
jgi:hypothetical protein